MVYSLFILSPIEGQHCHFQILIIMNKAAINIYLQVFFCGHKFLPPLNEYQVVWLVDHIERVRLVFKETVELPSKVNAPFRNE